MKHFLVLNDSLIFDEFLEYVDLKNVESEIYFHLLIEMMILMNLDFKNFKKFYLKINKKKHLPVG